VASTIGADSCDASAVALLRKRTLKVLLDSVAMVQGERVDGSEATVAKLPVAFVQ
jgi:hypothetical protein